jgi:hypothetical protein
MHFAFDTLVFRDKCFKLCFLLFWLQTKRTKKAGIVGKYGLRLSITSDNLLLVQIYLYSTNCMFELVIIVKKL